MSKEDKFEKIKANMQAATKIIDSCSKQLSRIDPREWESILDPRSLMLMTLFNAQRLAEMKASEEELFDLVEKFIERQDEGPPEVEDEEWPTMLT